MFGNPEWFRLRRCGWGLTPITWQGWNYTLLWVLAITIPFLALITVHLTPEAVVWLAVSIVVLFWDVHMIRHKIVSASHRPASPMGKNGHTSRLATRNFDLQLDRSST